MVKSIEIQYIKENLIKENNEKKDLINIISKLEKNNIIDKETEDKKQFLSSEELEFEPDPYFNLIEEKEKNRIKSLPLKLSINNKVQDINSVSRYFQYKKMFMKKYINILHLKDFIINNEPYPIFYINEDFNIMKYILCCSPDYIYYNYIIALYILAHMALMDKDSDIQYSFKEYNFFPKEKDIPENPNINLSKRMISSNLYYYNKYLKDCWEKICFKSDYLNWLTFNSHLSFELRFNKGIDFFVKSNELDVSAMKYANDLYNRSIFKRLFS